VDKKVTFPAGDLILEGRMHGGNMYSNMGSAVAAVMTFVTH